MGFVNYPYLNWLNDSMQKVNFSHNALQKITDLYKKVCENETASRIFHSTTALYENNYLYDFKEITGNIDLCVEQILGEHKYSGHLLTVLCMAKHTKKLYKSKNLPDDCFEGFLKDIKAKWSECLSNYSVDGVSNFTWYERFLNCTRFSLGRLQFEPKVFRWDDVTIEACNLKKGDTIIAVHIPGGEKLLKEDCEASFLRAEQFFNSFKKDGALPFICITWLLHPSLREILPETSNILQFADFFRCVYSADQEDQLIRIFGKVDFKDKEKLPEKTSLQRTYKKHLLNGGSAGIGVGYFFIKENKFIK